MLNKEYLERRDEEIEEISTNESIAQAIENGLIIVAQQVIGQGKEAFVCWGIDNEDRFVAVKTYKLYKTTHRGVIHGTRRGNPYAVISQFAKLEYYKNLDMFQAKLPVPEPYKYAGFSYAMELIGDEEGPAPLLRDLSKSFFDDPADVLEECIEILYDMFQAHFVHGDFSEHNLLWHDEKVHAIDFLQAKSFALKDAVPYGSALIPLSRAYRILRKDLNSLLPFFKRLFRIEVDYNEVLEYILGDIKENVDREIELNLETSS
ncbi:MAG: hypothetical protein GOP50_10060 [Candidatus Heimdallarchaeota archaeon]|nr:hypothetical protein [Candidatus Heimdallarchaeota archaeon]